MPSAYNTSEFRRSDGPLQHNAATAWASGYAGNGVTIAILDTGIDVDSPEFAGRLSSASRDMFSIASSRGLNATDDHGTNVAMVAAGARDNTGSLGMAWGSTILALRSDSLDTCQSDNSSRTGDDDCSFDDKTIADGIDYAVANGAKVINLSLGGDAPVQSLKDAVLRAVNAGMIVVVSAGNDGFSNPDAFAAGIDSAAPSGGVVIVGSVDEDGAISSFSNRAGNQPEHYLTARGQAVCCQYRDGRLYVDAEGYQYLFSGTSFSAPQVSGAAAILAQAFPALTGRQIADILLRSAFDAGVAGTDATYGRGILDIARALQPIGTTSLAGSTTQLALSDGTAVTSAAMGDAGTQGSLRTVVLDEYRRAFGVDLGGTITNASVSQPMHGALEARQRVVSGGNGQASVAFTIDARGKAGELPKVGLLRLAREDSEAARVLAARVTMQLSPKATLAFAYAESADGLVAQVQGQSRPAFMVARDAPGDAGVARMADGAFALRRQVGPWGLTLSADSGEAWTAASQRRVAEMRGLRDRAPVSDIGLALDRTFGSVQTSLGLTWMQEGATLLGAKFHDAFGMRGADTLFADAGASWTFAPGWRLGGAVRQGWTSARDGGMVASGSHVVSRAWSLDLARSNMFARGDTLGFRVSQPLRAERGGLNLLLPVDYSYTTQAPTYGVQSLSLMPQGRELTGELAWRVPLLTGDAAMSLFYRKDPGHYASLPDDKGVAFRWSRKF